MDDSNKETIGCMAVFILLTQPFMYMVNGWALKMLWGWFVVPTFDVPQLSIPVAIGIAVIAAFLTHGLHYQTNRANQEDRLSRMVEGACYQFINPLWCVGIGWIVMRFMR